VGRRTIFVAEAHNARLDSAIRRHSPLFAAIRRHSPPFLIVFDISKFKTDSPS
jgi:hypothetical protein